MLDLREAVEKRNDNIYTAIRLIEQHGIEVAAIRGGIAGPTTLCSDCQRPMVWAGNVWMCPACCYHRMQDAEARVKELEGEMDAGQWAEQVALSKVTKERDKAAADFATMSDHYSRQQARMTELEKARDALTVELGKHQSDLTAAAGELLVHSPRPGTSMAKILRANSLLVSEVGRLKALLREDVYSGPDAPPVTPET